MKNGEGVIEIMWGKRRIREKEERDMVEKNGGEESRFTLYFCPAGA